MIWRIKSIFQNVMEEYEILIFFIMLGFGYLDILFS